MERIAGALIGTDEYTRRLTELRERVIAVVEASRAAGRTRDWVAGYIAGTGLAFPHSIAEANRAFFEEAWPEPSTD